MAAVIYSIVFYTGQPGDLISSGDAQLSSGVASELISSKLVLEQKKSDTKKEAFRIAEKGILIKRR